MNIGHEATGPSQLEFRVGGETFPEIFSVPALNPGETHVVVREITPTRSHNITVRVTADVNGQIDEARETNNEETITLAPAQK